MALLTSNGLSAKALAGRITELSASLMEYECKERMGEKLSKDPFIAVGEFGEPGYFRKEERFVKDAVDMFCELAGIPSVPDDAQYDYSLTTIV